METGQWFRSSQGGKWWFDSGALSLDFGYTGGFGGDPAWEQFGEPEGLGRWLSKRFDRAEPHPAERDLTDARLLRGAVVRLATAVAAGETVNTGDVDLLNLYAATPDIPPRLAGGSIQAGAGHWKVSQMLSTIARDAITLFTEHDAARIHECGADDCALIFFDDSRSGNRRWCSMQRCGNRAKVRAHRARAKTA